MKPLLIILISLLATLTVSGQADSGSTNKPNAKNLTVDELKVEKKFKLSIYSFPETGSFELEYSKLRRIHYQTAFIRIYAVSGIQISDYYIDGSIGHTNIYNPDLTTGAYVYELYIDNKLIKTGTLIVPKSNSNEHTQHGRTW